MNIYYPIVVRSIGLGGFYMLDDEIERITSSDIGYSEWYSKEESWKIIWHLIWKWDLNRDDIVWETER